MDPARRFDDVELIMLELNELVNDPELGFEIFIPDPQNAGCSLPVIDRLTVENERLKAALTNDGPMTARHRMLVFLKLKFSLLFYDLARFHHECETINQQAILPLQLRRDYKDRALIIAHMDDYFFSRIITSDIMKFLEELGAKFLGGTGVGSNERASIATAAMYGRNYGILAKLMIEK